MTFAEKLKELRKENKLSQERLAEKIGVSRQAITKWETGTGMPDIDNLMAISKLFNITIDELVSNEIVNRETKEYLYESVTEYDIAESKHFEMKLGVARNLHVAGYDGEKIKVRLSSNTISQVQTDYKVSIDDIRKRIDIAVKSTGSVSNAISKEQLLIHVLLPNKYIGKVECEIIADTVTIEKLECENIELDAKSYNLCLNNVKGIVEINSNLDMNIECNCLEGGVEINQVSATSRISVPVDWEFVSVKKGIRNKMFYEVDGESVDPFDKQDSDNYIELNGINSELIISKS